MALGQYKWVDGFGGELDDGVVALVAQWAAPDVAPTQHSLQRKLLGVFSGNGSAQDSWSSKTNPERQQPAAPDFTSMTALHGKWEWGDAHLNTM